MKRRMLVFLTVVSLCLSFGNAYGAQQFGITTGEIKLGDIWCSTWSLGMHSLIVDGPNPDGTTNVYAVRINRLFDTQYVMADKSNDGGLTWLQSTGIAGGGNIDCDPAIALNPVAKSLHFAWNTRGGYPTDVYYGNGSVTTRVNGTVPAFGSGSVSIAVDGTSNGESVGVIHIVFAENSYPSPQIFHASSSDGGVTFTEPLPTGAFSSYADYSFAADSEGNLYLAYGGNKFKKKPAGGSWSSPYDIPTYLGGQPSMAVYDIDTIIISGGNKIAISEDGGVSWNVTTLQSGFGSSQASLAVSPDGKINYAWDAQDGIYFARTTRSLDPSSFGQPVLALSGAPYTVQNPHLALDDNGKAYIMAEHNGVAVFTKEK